VNITPEKPLPWGEGDTPYIHAWRVRALDSDPQEDDFCPVRNFTVRKDQDGDGIIDDMDDDPLNSDANNNGIPDGEDDDDYDGIPNYFEYEYSSQNGGDNRYYMNPDSSDTDGDGLSDIIEYDWNTFTNANIDSDGDGLSDTYEITRTHQTDPFSDDTDQDGITDTIDSQPVSADMDNDLLNDSEDPNPSVGDSDSDGFPDGFEVGRTSLINASVSPSGILCKGTEGWVFIDEDPTYNSIDFSNDGKIDFIGNGKLDDPELYGTVPGWVDENCGITTTWTYEQLTLTDSNHALGSYGSCWKYFKHFANEYYYPEENKSDGYYYHYRRYHGNGDIWHFRKFYDVYSCETVTGTVDFSTVGHQEIKPEGSDVDLTGNIYVFKVDCTTPSSEEIPRNIDAPPVDINYRIQGIKEGSLEWLKIIIKGKIEGYVHPHQRIFNVTEPEGTITWNGILYWGDGSDEDPRFLKKSSDVYIRYELCVKNRHSSKNRYWG